MQLFLEQLLNGIAMGSIYALVTLGLALVYGVMRILHVAHAAVYTIGAYAGLYLFGATGSLAFAFLGSMAICAAVGVIIERFLYFPLLKYPPFVPADRQHRRPALHRGGGTTRGRALHPHLPGKAPLPGCLRGRHPDLIRAAGHLRDYRRGAARALVHHDPDRTGSRHAGSLPGRSSSRAPWASTATRSSPSPLS